MELITEVFVTLWNETKLPFKFIAALVLILSIRKVNKRLTYRCRRCGEHFRKIYPDNSDTTTWERITDMLTPAWQYEHVYSPRVFECTAASTVKSTC